MSKHTTGGSMKKIFYGAAVFLTFMLSGCGGMSLAGAWAALCAGVSAGASVYSASKTTEEKTGQTAETESVPKEGEPTTESKPVDQSK